MIKDIQELNFPTYATLSSATVTLNDMGDRTISTQVKIDGSIVPDFSYDWEVEFKGERYIQPLRQPQASKGNDSLSSKVDLVFYHKTIWQLKRYYFVEMTSTESGTAIADQYIASLGLNLSDFCVAFQKVLDHYFEGEITIDLNPDWEYANEPSFMSISYSYIWDVLQKMYEVYGVRWTIEGSAIKVGYPSVELSHIFQYGYEGGLLQVERQVQDTNIRNSLLGRGGEKNLPAYYFKEAPEDSLFTSDPDAIPELANIYFSNLRGKTFRDYIKGWKAKHYGGTPMSEPTEAYTKGYTDTKFSPIEYVEDKDSIKKYGLLQGALDNNEEIYPSIQGAPNGEDVVVYVEPVLSDDVDSSIETESVIENLDPASITVEVARYSTYQDRIYLYDIEVKGGSSVTYIPSYRVVGYVEDADIKNVSLVLGELAFVNQATNTTYVDLANIPEGNYLVEFRYAIQNNGSNDVSVTVAVEQIKLQTISTNQVATNVWKPTFDIWVKNIWNSTRKVGESDLAYAERVWRPILGDRQGYEAKVCFSTGWLSGHSDYEFTIVDFAYDNSHEYNGSQSEWRLTLAKSDAELEATGKYIPSASTNGQAYAGDTFFFLGIDMPYQYVLWAEERLDSYKYIALNEVCEIQPKWVVRFDKVRLNQSEDNLAERIVVGGIINLADVRFINAPTLKLYLQSVTYTWNEQTLLYPDIEVVLGDKIIPIQNPVAQLQGSIDIINSQLSSIGGIGNLPQIVKTIGSSIFLRKDGISDTSKSHTKFANIVSGHNFRQGIVGGSDWGIYRDALGRSVAEFDKLVVRNEMFVNNLVINQVSSIGGEQIASAAAMVCSRVVENDNGYLCYFDQKEGTIGNLFQVNDIAYSQIFDAQNATTKYYKRVVKAIGVDYILLSDNEGEKDGEGVPIVGDNIIQMGNTTNTNRQSVIIISPLNGGSITLYNGINSFSLENKNYVGYGVNPSTQRAYLYGYGDMFFGDRELKSDFITYQIPEGSDKPKLVINATVEFGSDSKGLSSLSDFQGLAQDIEDTQTEVNNIKGDLDNVQDYIDNTLQEELDEIRAQADGQVQSYYFDYDPTLTNYPANEWTTDALKEAHIGDTFTNTQEYVDEITTPNAGKSWRWLNKDGVYGWYVIADSDATKALLMAQDALDLADGKRRVFIAEPYTPYDVGDLWANGADLKRCIKARETGDYVASDWDLATNYTDDSALNAYKNTVDGIVSDINQSIEEAEKASKAYTDEGKEALQASINALNKAKANINDVYTKAEADGEISKAEENAIAKAEELANTAQQLAEETAKAYADGEISASEAETLKKYQEALEEAQEAANVANEALGKADGAQNSADNAQSTANEAKGIANNAIAQLGSFSTTLEGFGVDLNAVKEQVDKEYRIWFVEESEDAESYVPSNSNQPAVEWTTAELKAEHDQDIFYNRYSGLAWRYVDGAWENITDSSTVEALAKAQEAQEQTKERNDRIAFHFGYDDYESMIDEARAEQTILKGGYINTKLIETDKLIAEKVAVTKGTTLIKIDTENIFKVSKILGSGVDDNTPVLQLSDKGLDFLDDSGNITAHFTGSEQAFLNIPTVPSKVKLSEISTTAAQNFTMLDFTNNTGTTAEVEIPQINLACRFYADSELQSFEPSGGISYLFTVASGGNNVVSKNDTFEVPESGWDIYDEYETGMTYVSGYQDFYHTGYSGGKIQVLSGQRLIISVQISAWTASGVVSSHFAARINGNTNPIGQNISSLLPVSIDDVIQPLLRSDYYGNGFVLAKDVNNYFALAINESADGGAQMEFRNEGVGFRIANNTISAWTGETWTPLDWNKILSLLS